MTHQGDRGGFNGHIAAAAHRDPHFRLGQRRGVVNAIANHRHFTACLLELLNRLRFTIRQHACDHLVNTRLAGNGVRGDGVIASQHHQPVAFAVQTRQGVGAVCTQRIANGEEGRQRTVHRQQHRRGAETRLTLRLIAQRVGRDAVFFQQRLIAEQQRFPLRLAANAKTAQRSKATDGGQRSPFGARDDGAGQRVAGALLQRGGQAQRVRFGDVARGGDGRHLRFTFGQGAGFVEHQRVYVACPLQRVGVTHQHAEFRRAPDA